MMATGVILMALSILVAIMKLSLMPLWQRGVVVCLWFMAIIAAVPLVSGAPVLSVEALEESAWWRPLLWIEGFALIAFCLGYAERTAAYRVLRWYPGVMCGVPFYFMLVYSFINFLDCNFALCGIAVGISAASLLLLPSMALNRFVKRRGGIVQMLFATEIAALVLTAL